MSGRGIDFLESWVHRNVTEDDRHSDRMRAAAMAERCKAEAAAAGISVDDMEPEWASVETIIYDAMQNDTDAELEIWKAVAAIRDRRDGNETLHQRGTPARLIGNYRDCRRLGLARKPSK
jgi:hypothetical protein